MLGKSCVEWTDAILDDKMYGEEIFQVDNEARQSTCNKHLLGVLLLTLTRIAEDSETALTQKEH